MKFREIVCSSSVLLVASFISAAAVAQNGNVPDAQVESNVIRQLATAPELSTQNIQTTTVYGVVTLSGNVHDEAMRSRAENLAARSLGVKKVVDQLVLGDAPAPASGDEAQQANAGGDAAAMNGNQAPTGDPGPGMVLQSDGTYAPADGSQSSQQPQVAGNQGTAGQPSGNYNNQAPPPDGQNPSYSGQAGQYAPPPDGSQPPHQPMYYGNAQRPEAGQYPYQGQRPGIPVTISGGTPLQIRLNRGFNSDDVTVGTPFTGIVMYDVVANGVVAIPRGAMVSGTVTDAKRAGTFRGQGQLSLQLTSLTLGGQVYPFNSVVWDARGRDKTGRTVGNAVGLGVLGALIGGAAGGGAGAAIGAGVGAGAGVAASGASEGGRVILPPETMLPFILADPANVVTVSQREMVRLSYAAGPPPAPRPEYRRRYYSPSYGYYYGPGM